MPGSEVCTPCASASEDLCGRPWEQHVLGHRLLQAALQWTPESAKVLRIESTSTGLPRLYALLSVSFTRTTRACLAVHVLLFAAFAVYVH